MFLLLWFQHFIQIATKIQFKEASKKLILYIQQFGIQKSPQNYTNRLHNWF